MMKTHIKVSTLYEAFVALAFLKSGNDQTEIITDNWWLKLHATQVKYKSGEEIIPWNIEYYSDLSLVKGHITTTIGMPYYLPGSENELFAYLGLSGLIKGVIMKVVGIRNKMPLFWEAKFYDILHDLSPKSSLDGILQEIEDDAFRLSRSCPFILEWHNPVAEALEVAPEVERYEISTLKSALLSRSYLEYLDISQDTQKVEFFTTNPLLALDEGIWDYSSRRKWGIKLLSLDERGKTTLLGVSALVATMGLETEEEELDAIDPFRYLPAALETFEGKQDLDDLLSTRQPTINLESLLKALNKVNPGAAPLISFSETQTKTKGEIHGEIRTEKIQSSASLCAGEIAVGLGGGLRGRKHRIRLADEEIRDGEAVARSSALLGNGKIDLSSAVRATSSLAGRG